MQDTLRLFIAIELSNEVHQKLGDLIRQIQPVGIRGINWVNPGNIHLTLKFLGDTPRKQVMSIINSLAVATKQTAPFEVSVEKTGCFPNPRDPKVLWVGVAPSESLLQLQKGIDRELVKLNIPAETRPFSPHLTLARISERCDLPVAQRTLEKLMANSSTVFGKVIVKRITLFQSTLSREGSLYSPQAYIPLHETN
jgi:2'-5' RNA ligase